MNNEKSTERQSTANANAFPLLSTFFSLYYTLAYKIARVEYVSTGFICIAWHVTRFNLKRYNRHISYFIRYTCYSAGFIKTPRTFEVKMIE